MKTQFRNATVSLAAALLLGLAGCATPPPTQEATAAPVFPARARLASGQVVDLSRNEPMGVFGTRALMAEAPGCSTVRMSDGQPVRLSERLIAPVLAPPSTNCPARNTRTGTDYLTLNRAVLLSDGLFAENPTTECFLPNRGGGNCRALTQ